MGLFKKKEGEYRWYRQTERDNAKEPSSQAQAYRR